MSSPPTETDIQKAHERFWNWVFSEKDGDDHPLKKTRDGEAQLQVGNMIIVGGSLQRQGGKNRTLRIHPDVKYVLVIAENCVYTMADGDGNTVDELKTKANEDMAGSTAKVSVNGSDPEIERLSAHSFKLNIQECIQGTGKSGMGEGCTKGSPPGVTDAAAACDYVVIDVDKLKDGDKIRITGRGGIDVTYKVKKMK